MARVNKFNQPKGPWGLSYKIVLKKLKLAASALSVSLDPVVLHELLNSLFPRSSVRDPVTNSGNFIWSGLSNLVKYSKSKKRSTISFKALGPDDFKAVVWKQVLDGNSRSNKVHLQQVPNGRRIP